LHGRDNPGHRELRVHGGPVGELRGALLPVWFGVGAQKRYLRERGW
jgi:hypothetical protein